MKQSSLILRAILLCLALAPAAVAAEFHVDNNALGDPGPGDTGTDRCAVTACAP